MFDMETVKERLKSFGYEAKEEDASALAFCVEKVHNTIKNDINCQDVPEGLEYIAVDMAAGEFLHISWLQLEKAVRRQNRG